MWKRAMWMTTRTRFDVEYIDKYRSLFQSRDGHLLVFITETVQLFTYFIHIVPAVANYHKPSYLPLLCLFRQVKSSVDLFIVFLAKTTMLMIKRKPLCTFKSVRMLCFRKIFQLAFKLAILLLNPRTDKETRRCSSRHVNFCSYFL